MAHSHCYATFLDALWPIRGAPEFRPVVDDPAAEFDACLRWERESHAVAYTASWPSSGDPDGCVMYLETVWDPSEAWSPGASESGGVGEFAVGVCVSSSGAADIVMTAKEASNSYRSRGLPIVLRCCRVVV